MDQPETTPQPQLPPSLVAIIRGVQSLGPLTGTQAKQLVANAGVTPADLEPWADFDHPAADSYGRKLVYDGGFFELMVMSWAPGDYSAIHDHGYTVWGAVQVFGPAEHGIYSFDEERLVTLSRSTLTPGRVLAVNHDLIHQMGNPAEERFLTLHLYGNHERESEITADARVFDLLHGEVRRTSGGVFFGLPEDQINSREACPPPDYHSWLFDATKQLRRAQANGSVTHDLKQRVLDADRWETLKEDLAERVNETGHMTDSRHWAWLYAALRDMSRLQHELIDDGQAVGFDEWKTYASYYDRVIGTTNSYIAKYFGHVFEQHGVDADAATLIDVGCGTGWFESVLQERFGMRRENLLAVDPSEAMVEVAKDRAPTRRAGLLDLDDSFGQFDVAFCNSYQYLPHEDFEQAVRKMHAVTKPGGLCVSEFITVDHVRWYPNVIYSEDDTVISLRNPTLRERGGCTYQESEIININRLDGMRITYEGVHRRFMVSPRRARELFEEVFGQPAFVSDAITLEEVPPLQETCTSTRYVVCVRRGE